MSERQFFEPTARTKIREAIESVEAQTSAELVVAIRRRADPYRHIDITIGCAFAFVTLLLLLFLPWPFDDRWMPIDITIAFAIGTAISCTTWSTKRWLVRNATLHKTTWQATCTLFHEKGISRTSGRNGVLVTAFMLEQQVHVAFDIGINPTILEPGWTQTQDKLRTAVRNHNFTAFTDALATLGPILGAAMPRADDDINELPDEPDMP